MFKLLGAILIIIGTSVGVGMLGLPVDTAEGGFLPSVVAMFFVWLITTITALLFSEVCIAHRGETNFSTLSEEYFGLSSRGLISLVYVVLFGSLITAYIKGGGVFLAETFNLDVPWKGAALFVAIFTPFIIFGTGLVDKLNALLAFFLFFSYFVLLFSGWKFVDHDQLLRIDFKASFFSLPLMITSFSYHATLPSIIQYLKKDRKLIRTAIIVGSIAVFAIYLLWQYLIMGIIPSHGQASLSSALASDQTAISYLGRLTKSTWVEKWGYVFAFSALTTSFLGVSIGVIDFFRDAVKVKSSFLNRALISVLVFLPPLILSVTKIRIFYISLKYGAGLSCILLLILIPALLNRKISLLKKRKISKRHSNILRLVFAFVVVAIISTIGGFF